MGHSLSARISSASASASRRFSASEYAAIRFIQLRSAPAEKLFPSAARTIARTSASAPNRPISPVKAAISASSKALCSSARASVKVASPRGSIAVWKPAAIAYIRNTPNFVGSIGALAAAARPSPSTMRVWAGSITPSSHSRAEA